MLQRYGVLDTLIQSFIKPYQEKQEVNNPYEKDENPQLYATYWKGWYSGLVAGEISQIVVTDGTAEELKGTTTYERVEEFVSSTKTAKIAKRIKSPYDTAKARVAVKLVRGSKRVGSATLGGAKSVGSTVRVWRLSNKVDIDGDELSEAGQQNLRWYLEITGEDGVRKLNHMDGKGSLKLLNLGTICKAPGFSISSIDSGCGLSDDERERLIQTVASSTDNPDTFATKVSELEPETQREIHQELVEVDSETGEDLVWMVERVNAKRLNELRAEGIDFSRHAEGLDIYMGSEKVVGKNLGDFAEIIAQETVLQKYRKQGRLVPGGQKKGVTIYTEEGHEYEFDHMVLSDDGSVKYILETKSFDGGSEQAFGQTQSKLVQIQQEGGINSVEPGGITLKLKDLPDPFAEQDKIIIVGPSSDYDEQIGFSEKQLKALYKTAQELK